MCVSLSILALVIRDGKYLFFVSYYIGICRIYGSTTPSILSQKRHDLRKIFIAHRMCISIYSATLVQYISHSKKNSTIYHHKCTHVST